MQREKSKITFGDIFFYVCVALVTCVFFVLLGLFYKAIEHSIGLNILVWLITIILAHSFVYILRWLFNLIRKKKIRHSYIDFKSLASGAASVAIICLFGAKSLDDYLYLSIMAGISGIVATIEGVLYFRKKKAKQNDSR